jgi:DNA-binding PadR family transcriptional regulator
VLLDLQRQGLVNVEVIQQVSLPAKKVYSINEGGRALLRENLLQKPELGGWPKSFLLQMAWAEELSDDEILGLLDQYAAELTDRLNLLQGEAQRRENSPHRSEREAYLWRRIADNFIESCRTELEWTSQTRLAVSTKNYRN